MNYGWAGFGLQRCDELHFCDPTGFRLGCQLQRGGFLDQHIRMVRCLRELPHGNKSHSGLERPKSECNDQPVLSYSLRRLVLARG